MTTPASPAAAPTSRVTAPPAPSSDRRQAGLEAPTQTGVVNPPAASRPYRAASLVTLAGALTAIALFGVLAFEHRWISDDGMIVVREVRQILTGSGPNYNPFQRDEVDTSPLWTWLLVAVAFVVRGDIALDAVALGAVLAVGGLALALAGSITFHRQQGAARLLLPVGALIPLAVSGFWDFATSGLETGLSIFWLGLVWTLLVSVTKDASRPRLVVIAVTVGLGPLVRPDFALATGVICIALLLIVRPGWRHGAIYAGVAGVLPVAYQVFRMGYYGITVPMPALAKEAGSSLWIQGWRYLNDYLHTYELWLPLLCIAVLIASLLARTDIDRRRIILIAAPVLSGVLLGGYVAKVGGDYMQTRMWIPATFAILLPTAMLPVGRCHRTGSFGAALLMVWALFTGLTVREPHYSQGLYVTGIINERAYEVMHYAGSPDLATTESRTRNLAELPMLARLLSNGDRDLILRIGGSALSTPWIMPMSPSVPDRIGFVSDNLGVAAAVMPLDGTVIDTNGLASPVAGHLLLERRKRPGHEKWLPTAWVLGEYADPAAINDMQDTKDVTRAQALAARHALSCGSLKELMDSVDKPLSFSRFWQNLTGSLSRTELRIPADPFVAERRFCNE